jgi:hypothetical protein
MSRSHRNTGVSPIRGVVTDTTASPHSMATTILPIIQRVEVSAVFSSVIYEAHHSSVVPGATSHDRLKRAIDDPAVKHVIGEGWQVWPNSTQDFATPE